MQTAPLAISSASARDRAPMQISEQQLAALEHPAFRHLRLFHLDDHVGAIEYLCGSRGDRRPARR
jgi:hypothetical protein